jgi:hypothetical protein
VQSFELFLDSIFLIDIFLNFFKVKGTYDSLSTIAKHYAWYVSIYNYNILYSGYLIFDLCAVVPGLVTFERFMVYAFKIARFARTERLFRIMHLLFDKCLFTRYNKTKLKDTVHLVSILLFVMFGTHVLACCWIYLGILDMDLPPT